jgi:methylenetetrahydrofolate dehydrogenase (NADP+)/methenyltetrahydrofolate cyclohydrolase
MGTLLDGKAVAASIQQAVAADVEALRRGRGVTPTLAVVLSGEDPGSKVYVRRKRQAARDLGIQTRHSCTAAAAQGSEREPSPRCH